MTVSMYEPDFRMIFPVKLTRPDTAPVPANLQLETLTDFVTFLER
jgi:hypothetical protein